MQGNLSIHSNIPAEQDSQQQINPGYDFLDPYSLHTCHPHKGTQRSSNLSEAVLQADQPLKEEKQSVGGEGTGSSLSMIIAGGLERARKETKKEAQMQILITEITNNAQIEKEQYEELRDLLRLEIIRLEREQLTKHFQNLEEEIKALIDSPKQCHWADKKSERPTTNYLDPRKNCLNDKATLREKPGLKKKQANEAEQKHHHGRRRTTLLANGNKRRSSRTIEKRSPVKKNVSEHLGILQERATLLRQFNTELLDGFLNRIRKMDFENALLRKQLNIICRELANVPHYHETKKKSHAGLCFARTPRHLSQNSHYKSENGSGTVRKIRMFLFQREKSPNSKRSLSRNEGKSPISIKNRVYSAYSLQKSKIGKPIEESALRHVQPSIRGQYFQEKGNDKFSQK